jgi:D-alanyl-D-alanine carboxypeptidase
MPNRRSASAYVIAGLLMLSSACAPAGSGTGTTPAQASSGSPAATASSSRVPAIRLDEATKARLQSSFERSFATKIAGSQTPGAAVLVSIGDDVWSSQLGVSNLATNEPIRPDSRFRIASLTKTFVATAILQLADAGRLSLDDPLEKYVTGIANGKQITIRQLLAMSAGVWSFTYDKPLIARFDADPMLTWSVEDTVDLVRSKPADYPPDAKVMYSDSNYVLLGVILEKASGQSVPDYLRAKILEPLGLTGTVFPTDDQPGVPAPATVGYLPVEGKGLRPIESINPAFAWASGAMTSTAQDLARWAKELTEGTLISPAAQQQRLKTRQFTGVDVDYGYGLGVMNTTDMIGHDGGIVGSGAVMFRYPAADATFVVLVNASSNFDNASLDIYNALLGDLYPDQITKPTGR